MSAKWRAGNRAAALRSGRLDTLKIGAANEFYATAKLQHKPVILTTRTPRQLKHVRTGIGPIPFILMAAKIRIEEVTAAKKAGASGFIVKPFNPATLKAKIDAAWVSTHLIDD